MSLTSFKTHFGLSRPYDFSVAIPFLLSLVLLAGVVAVFAVFYATDHVSFGTARFAYFVYLVLTLFAAALLSRRAKISYFLIALAFIELALGLTTSVLAKYEYAYTALPRNAAIDERFDYHSFLQGVPKPNFKTESEWGEIRHNSLGLRGKEVENTNTKKIFVYGGSSTYDISVGEEETWVEQVNALLGSGVTLINFGVPGYSTAESIMQTAFYGDIDGAYPSCAVYYLGWNDIHNAHIPNLDRGYADFHFPGQIGTLEVRKVLRIGGFSPLFIVASRTLSGFIETATYPINLSGYKPVSGSDERLENIFLRNIQTLSAINKARNVRTVFMAQMYNREKLRYNNTSGWFPMVEEKDTGILQDRFNAILGQKAAEMGDGFIDADVKSFLPDDFTDDMHFNAQGAKKFAKIVSNKLKGSCRLFR